MTEPAAPAAAPASIAQRDELVVAAEATVIPTLLALHGRQRQALEALRVCIAALRATAPAGLVAQEAELAAALAATETALRGYGLTQVDAGGGGDVAERAGEGSQGAIVNGGTFYGTVIGYQENQAGAVSSWACYTCGVENPPNTSFCFKCSTQLVRMCPECRQNTSMIGSKICGNCGYPFDLAIRREVFRRQIGIQRENIRELRLQYARFLRDEKHGGNNLRSILLINLFVFCCCASGGDDVARTLIVFICLVSVVVVVVIIGSKKQKSKKSMGETGMKIHQLEQSIIQFQRALEETDIRKV
ncbi:MAG TPA: zinc ribbon domain-containing protein [Roseiflexaceae bacterium]|nr:zinc ribbon domain-containing protein [Roseiflexaceae bacterium]